MSTELPPICRDHQSAPPEVRLAVLARDGYMCQDCGRRGKSGHHAYDLQVHHLLNWSRGGDHAMDNLVTLCGSCHKKRDREAQGEGIRASYARHVEMGIVQPSRAWLKKNPHIIPNSKRPPWESPAVLDADPRSS